MVRRARTALTVVVVAALFAACSGDDSDDGESADETVAPSTTEAASEDEPTTTTEVDEVEGFEASTVVAGDQHACALDRDGMAWCWGYNRFGQLGNGDTTESPEPVEVESAPELVSLAAGRYFTCGVDADGAAWCWGDNSSGQIGVGVTGAGSEDQNRTEATPVLGEVSLTEIAAGQNHVCGVDAEGALWCWGAYPSGQLGVGLTDDALEPIRGADGIVVDQVAAAGANTCVLDADGAAWCFGNNSFGQLGNGVTDNRAQPVPVAVGGGHTFVDIAVGDRHGCGLDAEGVVWCWGANDSGQLGDGSGEPRLVPTAVDADVVFASVAAGNAHTCALDADGAAWCWGENTDGRLGDADEDAESATGDDALAPVSVTTDADWEALTLGEEFSCGLSSEGVVLCWGNNREGWLGDGTKDPRLVPTPVLAVG